ncbi:MAG: CarD family transcriptional regulator [Clostridiales bacterium]|jgi:CarD family transcriptional regulator|nr:CarD family transcriptional regulator [Clostridiales bacterium]
MFKVGDYIVYPMYGAGVITEIVEKDFLGEMRTYYNVSLPYCRMEASVPVDNCDKLGVRPIVDPSRIDEVIEVLKGDTEKMNNNWNKRYRENTERMQTGDILEVAAVVRNLVRTDRLKPLSTGEKKLLNTAKQILESELIYAGEYTMEEADEMVESNI